MPALTLQQAFELAREHQQAGRFGEAESLYRQILAHVPDDAGALHMLGLLCHQTARGNEGIALIQRAIALNAASPVYHGNLGVLLATAGRTADAIVAYSAALVLAPNDSATRHHLASAYNDLAARSLEQGLIEDAIAACRHALALKPDFPEAHYNLGNALKDQGLLDDAIAAYARALELRPDFKPALSNMGTCLKDTARLNEAIACYRKTEAISPDPRTPDNRLYLLCFHPDYGPKQTYEETAAWNRAYARTLAPAVPSHPNDRSPERRLRIGYVSPDFCDHPIGRFLLPVLANHDREQFEVFCYSNVRRPDFVTGMSRDRADGWRDVAAVNDEQLAQQVRDDRIDVLVDLALHLAGNRLMVFARKPAPVRVTWLGYPGTTGLETIDYRLTDPYMEPPGPGDQFYSENTVRLPDSFWCFDPITDEPPVNELPALRNGFITFGCLNNFCKVTEETLRMWGGAMNAAPGSRLLLLAPVGSARQWVTTRLATMGIDPHRLEFTARLPRPAYLGLHHRIDVALDTFPCNGHTTTFDALWMGVAVITRPWLTPVSRGGVSILSNLALTRLIAQSAEQYAQIAAARAADLPALSQLRTSLRARMRASPLMDAPRFTRNLEAAYRQMWRKWSAAARGEELPVAS